MKIADAAVEILRETNNPAVGWGDVTLLDMIAKRTGRSKLFERHPLKRHQTILAALSRDIRFKKSIRHLKPGYRGNQFCRIFYLIARGR